MNSEALSRFNEMLTKAKYETEKAEAAFRSAWRLQHALEEAFSITFPEAAMPKGPEGGETHQNQETEKTLDKSDVT